jgi:hypothetical protein
MAMLQVIERDRTLEADTPQAVEATLNYIVDTGEQIFTQTGDPGSLDLRAGGQLEPRRVTIRNGRAFTDRFVLEQEGFRFLRHDTKVVDFFNDEEVRQVYYPEVEDLVESETGAARIFVFDHTLRTADDDLRQARRIREVVPRVHNDYTEWSGPQRVRDLLPSEAEALLRRRFAIVQVWRPIRYPVETFPLAICDARSVSPVDLIVSERRYPDRVGQTYAIKYNRKHRWYWFPRMRRDEALVFKTYESLKDARARWTAHTAFDDPSSPSAARPRESIEIRALAFF